LNKEIDISDAIIIAIFTFLGYVIAFAYEYGRATYFGIPLELISLDITHILISLSVLAVFVYLIIHLSNFLYMGFSNFSEPVRASISQQAFWFFSYIGLIWVFRRDYIMFIFLSILFLMFVSFDFLFPLITQRNVSGYINKLTAHRNIVMVGGKHSLFGLASRVFGSRVYNFILYMIMFVIIAYYSGNQSAKGQYEFYMVTKYKNTVVAGIYGDRIVSVVLDNSAYIMNEYLINKISDTDVTLKKIVYGPLKNKNNKAAPLFR
jgi:hypothetical protein